MTQHSPGPRAQPNAAVEAAPASRPDPSLDGFAHGSRTVDGVRLHYVEGGRADADIVLLLAGFPESWYAWRKVMPSLADRYRVIAPDLPGQGDSDRPTEGYDTESLAAAVHGLVEQLGATRYALVAHDVGAWVAYPYAALFGEEVRRLVLMDAGIPGITLPDALPTAPDRAWRTWHFAFHGIPDLPEALIAGREQAYLDWFLRRKTANPDAFSDADITEYLRVFRKDGGLRAGLAYYRSAPLSARQNRALAARGKLSMPVLAMSADQGSIPDMAGPLRDFASDVRGVMVPHCGHFLPEEQPGAVARVLLDFLGQG
jgi:pimeloyl-ACP methyl ester carboxylesterase